MRSPVRDAFAVVELVDFGLPLHPALGADPRLTLISGAQLLYKLRAAAIVRLDGIKCQGWK